AEVSRDRADVSCPLVWVIRNSKAASRGIATHLEKSRPAHAKSSCTNSGVRGSCRVICPTCSAGASHSQDHEKPSSEAKWRSSHRASTPKSRFDSSTLESPPRSSYPG